MLVLGIETSCDETAVAIVNDKREIIAETVLSQIDIHKEFGGVVPEVAAREHIEILDKLILKVLKEAGLSFDEIDAIAATSGPGLIGGVMVGMLMAKAIASVKKKPFIAVNHLEGHALTVRLTEGLEFPYLLLLVSGGHCQILTAEGIGQYKKIGGTIDDAVGEAFDKVAQMIGLQYPGGPKVEKLAKQGDENRFKFPKPLLEGKSRKTNSTNFSFSGLKTAVRREIEKLTGKEYNFTETPKLLKEQDKADIAASFQKTITDIISDRILNAIEIYELEADTIEARKLVIAGGVSANKYISERLAKILKDERFSVHTPPLKFTGDNAVMVAWAGLERFRLGLINDLDFKPKARWELEDI